MKATFQSDRAAGSLINLWFNQEDANDQATVEVVGQWLVDEYGFDWVTEDLGVFTVGAWGYTIKELQEFYKLAKQQTAKVAV